MLNLPPTDPNHTVSSDLRSDKDHKNILDHAAWVEKHFWEPEYESILRPVYAERFEGCDVNTDL